MKTINPKNNKANEIEKQEKQLMNKNLEQTKQ